MISNFNRFKYSKKKYTRIKKEGYVLLTINNPKSIINVSVTSDTCERRERERKEEEKIRILTKK